MRVLQFAFDGDEHNPFLPIHYNHNTIAYTGTHDNDTSRGWYEALPPEQRNHLWHYLQREPGTADEVAGELMRLAWQSPAAMAIAPLQDLLNLDTRARMNLPGTAEGNWLWRTTAAQLDTDAWRWLGELTDHSHRRTPANS